jgi:hypothetical protein
MPSRGRIEDAPRDTRRWRVTKRHHSRVRVEIRGCDPSIALLLRRSQLDAACVLALDAASLATQIGSTINQPLDYDIPTFLAHDARILQRLFSSVECRSSFARRHRAHVDCAGVYRTQLAISHYLHSLEAEI